MGKCLCRSDKPLQISHLYTPQALLSRLGCTATHPRMHKNSKSGASKLLKNAPPGSPTRAVVARGGADQARRCGMCEL
jgi:hypothetical protein